MLFKIKSLLLSFEFLKLLLSKFYSLVNRNLFIYKKNNFWIHKFNNIYLINFHPILNFSKFKTNYKFFIKKYKQKRMI